MSYKSEPISAIIRHLNSRYYLPAIQREFVWKPEQIIQLFDSIMRRYPIGSFLFWELDRNQKDSWQAYKFLEYARQGGTHNELANTEGVADLTLILDGQQRLTSLLVGLKGYYSTKKKYKRWDDASAWQQRRLYLDLLREPSIAESDDLDAEAGVYYKFAFFENAPDPSADHYWFPVARIMSFTSEDQFDVARDNELDKLPGDVTRDKERTFKRNLDRLYSAVHKDDAISFYVEREQDYDRVLDIFVRANEGGTKLSKSDLLLSMITSKWGEMNAREEIFSFVDYLNEGMSRKNSFDKDFIMKSCLVLADLPIAYRVQNFNNYNLALIERKWEAIKKAIENAVKLANSFGIEGENLTSANALIPIAYYLMQGSREDCLGTTEDEIADVGNIRIWLISSLLNQVFGGASDSLLKDMRERIKEAASEKLPFPVTKLTVAASKAGRAPAFDEFSVNTIFGLRYGKRQTFLALTLLYDDNLWGNIPHQIDHLFPRSLFSNKHLSQCGLDQDQVQEWQSKKDCFANLTLLLSRENGGKSDSSLRDWLRSRDASFLERHFIPTDERLWEIEHFPEFLTSRELLMRKRFESLLKPELQESGGQDALLAGNSQSQ